MNWIPAQLRPTTGSLFGEPAPRVFARPPGQQQQAFAGADWIGAAQDLAAARGVEVEALRAGQRVLIGGEWFRVYMADDWQLEPIGAGF